MTSAASAIEHGRARAVAAPRVRRLYRRGARRRPSEIGNAERAVADVDVAPIVYRLYLRGVRLGHLVPIHAWYEQCDSAAEIRARIAAIPGLVPLVPTTREAWMLSTRIVQRRAVRVADQDAPIRKFALQLAIEPVSVQRRERQDDGNRVPQAARQSCRGVGGTGNVVGARARHLHGDPERAGLEQGRRGAAHAGRSRRCVLMLRACVVSAGVIEPSEPPRS